MLISIISPWITNGIIAISATIVGTFLGLIISKSGRISGKIHTVQFIPCYVAGDELYLSSIPEMDQVQVRIEVLFISTKNEASTVFSPEVMMTFNGEKKHSDVLKQYSGDSVTEPFEPIRVVNIKPHESRSDTYEIRIEDKDVLSFIKSHEPKMTLEISYRTGINSRKRKLIANDIFQVNETGEDIRING